VQKNFIAHIDLDCFFVSVERIKDPSLIGKPVVVGGSSSRRGVVASASYEARKFGVHSAMPTARAIRICPGLIVVSGHHGEYAQYSDRLHSRMLDIAPVVERASIDEMYFDFTGCESLYDNDLPGYMKIIQSTVRDEFQLPCTIALAPNKLVAKIAANTVKPNGVIFVPHGTEAEFLAPLPIGVIPGIGVKTEEVLRNHGFQIVADIQRESVKRIIDLLGAHGDWIHRAAHGNGSIILSVEHIAKSISREETFPEDISDIHRLETILFTLVADVCSTLRSKSSRAGTITIKYRTSKFETMTRQERITPSNYDPEIFTIALQLLRKIHDGKTPIRLIGVGLSNFVDDEQEELDLFPASEKKSKVLHAIDRLREKYGDGAIKIGDV
jgi:DNA polymerase IV